MQQALLSCQADPVLSQRHPGKIPYQGSAPLSSLISWIPGQVLSSMQSHDLSLLSSSAINKPLSHQDHHRRRTKDFQLIQVVPLAHLAFLLMPFKEEGNIIYKVNSGFGKV